MAKEFGSKSEVIEFWEDTDIDSKKEKLLYSFYTRLTVDRIKSASDITEDSCVLEVGSGWGRIITHMTEVTDVVGVDITEDLLQAQSELAKDASQIAGDAEQLPFPSNTFDVVYAVRMLQYFDDIDLFLSEFARITKPNGNVIVVQPNKLNPYHQLTYYTELLSPYEVADSFEAVGLSIDRVDHFGFSHPDKPIPILEKFGQVPVLRRLSGLFLVKGSV